ncbi:MAG: hypothetical protein Q7U26_06780 [Aquabacterium sp.]|nr:hypothetical protein [Aquabacterium sp.]
MPQPVARATVHAAAFTLSLLAGALAALPAVAAGPQASPAVEARYQRELAACAAPGYVGDRQACRRDAGAGRSRAAGPADADVDASRLARNALLRCAPLPEADRADCMARMQGQGTATGKAADGGIYRELVTRQVGTPAAAASAAASNPAR